MKKPKENVCANCRHWKNEQAELEYCRVYGICTCPKWKFSVTGEADVMVLNRSDRSSKHMGVHRFENQSAVVPIGQSDRSNYCLVTEEKFGCIHYES